MSLLNEPNGGNVPNSSSAATIAAQYAVSAEQNWRLADDVMSAVVAGGFARHFVPRVYGGNSGSFTALSRSIAELAEFCPATAWCASVTAHLARMVAYLPAEGGHEVWHDGPDAVVVGSLGPGGRAEVASDGWTLAGKWSYVSAVDHSDWALLCGMAPDKGGRQALMFAIPRQDYSVVESWSDVGMRATGSHSLVVEDVFVPRQRVMNRSVLLDGRAGAAMASCHTVPLRAVNALSFAAPALGAARGMLKIWQNCAISRMPANPIGSGIRQLPFAAVFARATGEIDCAEMLLDRASAVADHEVRLTPVLEARNLRDCSLAVELLVTATDRLFKSAGTSAHSVDAPMQRFWRDIHSMASHVVLQFDAAADVYTTEAFGPATQEAGRAGD